MRAIPVLLLVLTVSGCAAVLKAGGYPPEAMRKSAPAEIGQALAVGAPAPALKILLTDGTTAELRGTPTVLVFYRGHW